MAGTPWLGGPMHLHAWRMYECQWNETSKCEYQQGYWRFWYEADHRYAVPTVAFFTVTVLLFSIGHLMDIFLGDNVQRTPFLRKTIAAVRYPTYKAFRLHAINWNSAPLGVLALGVVGVIYFFCMTLAPRPYYWSNNENGDWGSSPPIATRSGWLSLACIPFIFLTAGKGNFITALTGVSHEKLQVFHRWISYACFVTALLHTFPFIVYNIQTGTMKEQWNTSVFYWTGVVALVAQGWLTFASFSPLRNLSYEWFKFSHFLAALIFILFLFFHCDYTLSSWDYFIVTGVFFALSWLHRQIRIYFEHGLHRATIELTLNGFICVRVPTKARWHVGQHFFVRFLTLGIHSGSIHPFTACSLPQRAGSLEVPSSELVFYIRPRGGFTARLARLAESQPLAQMRVMLDGPYGGIDMRKMEQSQHLLAIAGGSGAGWVLPMISAFLQKQRFACTEKGVASGSMKVVLATRDIATCRWFAEAVRSILPQSEDPTSVPKLQIKLFYTGPNEDASTQKTHGQVLRRLTHPEEAQDVKEVSVGAASATSDSISASSIKLDTRQFDRRPDLRSLVREEAENIAANEQLGVFVCGPLSMQHDVRNAVAGEQLGVLKGRSRSVYLHMEHFSWA